jgi:hypothetical protein
MNKEEHELSCWSKPQISQNQNFLSRGEQTRTDFVVSKPGMESHGEPDSIGDLIQRRHPRRLFVLAGERRRRALNLQFASPPVATRNGLAPPARIGAPEINAPQRNDKRVCAWKGSLLKPQDPSNAAKTRKPQQTAIIPGLLTTENSCFENYATQNQNFLDYPVCSRQYHVQS